jgi:hypothetical protein
MLPLYIDVATTLELDCGQGWTAAYKWGKNVLGCTRTAERPKTSLLR